MHLRYSCMSAGLEHDENRHAQVVMKELGITYQHSTPQSMLDCWQFWNCKNVPDEIPGFLSVLTVDPMKMVGYGLNQKDAEKIRDGV